MSWSTNPGERWRLLVPPETVIIDVTADGYRAAAERLAGLAPRTPVALVGGRCGRRLARRGGVTISDEFVALPSLAQPIAIASVADRSLRWFASAILTVPSGTSRGHGVKWAIIKLLRWRPGLLRRVPVGDRLVIGVRP